MKLEDPRSVLALTKVLTISRGVCNAVARFGLAAVDPVLGQLDSQDVLMRNNAAFTLGKLVESDQSATSNLTGTGNALVRIKRALITTATTDRSGIVRKTAVEALGSFKMDEEIVRTLRTIAETDPDVQRRTIPSPQEAHPVRDAAAEILKRLK